MQAKLVLWCIQNNLPMTSSPKNLLLLLCLCPITLFAQARLNLFTDCQCNKTLLKQELPYVNHTVDPVGHDKQIDLGTSRVYR
ncbi:MAG: hypothetical protein AAF597_13305, partial [Bacteroidota bacterium]